MSDIDPGAKHDEVVTSLLDLQRRLRGDNAARGEASEPMAAIDLMRTAPATLADPETVSISEGDVRVLMTPEDERLGFAPVTRLPTAVSAMPDDRVAALNERLSRLEDDLSGVLGSIEEIRSDSVSTVHVEQRLIHEVASTRSDLQRSLHEGFTRLQDTMARIQGQATPDTGDEEA